MLFHGFLCFGVVFMFWCCIYVLVLYLCFGVVFMLNFSFGHCFVYVLSSCCFYIFLCTFILFFYIVIVDHQRLIVPNLVLETPAIY